MLGFVVKSNGSYHFGVVACLQRHGKGLLNRVSRVAGSSAGALVAALTVLAPQHIPDGLKLLYTLAEEVNMLRYGALTPGFVLNERLLAVVQAHLPQDISPSNGVLYISVTHQKRRNNVLLNSFKSSDHLFRCLLASCYIPMYSIPMKYFAPAPIIDGQPYIDGGYSCNLPVFDDMETITVSPFSGDGAVICPRDVTLLNDTAFEWQISIKKQLVRVNLHNIVRGAQALFPPSRTTLEEYYQIGFKDTMRYLLERQLFEQ